MSSRPHSRAENTLAQSNKQNLKRMFYSCHRKWQLQLQATSAGRRHCVKKLRRPSTGRRRAVCPQNYARNVRAAFPSDLISPCPVRCVRFCRFCFVRAFVSFFFLIPSSMPMSPAFYVGRNVFRYIIVDRLVMFPRIITRSRH